MKKLEDYTGLSYSSSMITDGRIILADEVISATVRDAIQGLKTTNGQELRFLEGEQLAVGLEKKLEDVTQKEEDILFVFPGNGANYPRKLSQICQEYGASTSVMAKRICEPGVDPVVTVDVILPEMFLVTTVKTIVVVDDVISSGLTMQKLYHKNAWRFPQAKWLGVAWVTQIPQSKSKSGVNGYSSVYASYLVGKTNGQRAPINSISTLRKDPEIARSYANKHFTDPDSFLHLISS